MPDPGVFAAAIDDLFADPAIAADGLWRAGGADPALPVRAIARLGDRITDFSDARFVNATAMLEVRVAEMPTPASGDTVETGGRLLIVQGEPLADALRLVWTVECRPA
jgi:hypothetical protein